MGEKNNPIVTPWMESKAAWLKKLCSRLWGKLWLRILFQIIGWGTFHWIWLVHCSWRYFSDAKHEFFSFYIIPIGIYAFYFLAYKCCYQQKYLFRFIFVGLVICSIAVIAEYSYVIGPILDATHPPVGKEEESYSYVRIDTWADIILRDLALFSIVGFGLIFRDALKYVKVQKEELAYWRERHSFQNEIEGHRRHEHFAGNLFNAYLAAHPGEQQDLAECLYLYNFSARNNTQAFYPLRQEVDFAKRLIAFYEKLYPEAVVYCQEKGDMPAVYILPLVTESLIGNMFKHGVTGQGGCMSVCFDYTNPDEVKMQFRNKVGPGRGFTRRSGARGLDVLSRRLDLAYGKDAVLQWDFPGDEVVATLTIPV